MWLPSTQLTFTRLPSMPLLSKQQALVVQVNPNPGDIKNYLE